MLYNFDLRIYIIIYIIKMNYCKVKGCRFDTFHVTKKHKCGKCYEFGHGQVECGNKELIESLNLFDNDIVNNPCNICSDDNKFTHITEGHTCILCDRHKDSEHSKYCPENGTKEFDSQPNINLDNIELNKGYYCDVYIGMGCSTYVRKNLETDKLESLFMHSDDWGCILAPEGAGGQYGDNTSHLPRFRKFIQGYKYTK